MSSSKNNKRDTSFKLDRLDKKNIYSVPEKYFDELPGIIQTTVVKKERTQKKILFNNITKYVIPATFILAIIIYAGLFNNTSKANDYEAMIAEISDIELIAYLENSDLSVDEILQNIDLDEALVDSIESEINILSEDLEVQDIDEIINEFGEEYL